MIMVSFNNCPRCGIKGKKEGSFMLCPSCNTLFSEFGIVSEGERTDQNLS